MTLYRQQVKRVVMSFVLIFLVLFGAFQLIFNENVSEKVIPKDTAVSYAVESVRREKNALEYQLEEIGNSFEGIFS